MADLNQNDKIFLRMITANSNCCCGFASPNGDDDTADEKGNKSSFGLTFP